jgi:hypothetical protein
MVQGTPADEKDWKGQGSVSLKIRKALGLNRNTKIYSIFPNVLACKRDCVLYTGARDVESLLGRPCTLALDFIEAQIIADSTEDGFGREHTKLQINK